jgi:hypothetical protein
MFFLKSSWVQKVKMTDYLNKKWIMQETEELIETLLLKLNLFSIMFWIDLLEFYK